MHCRVTTHTRMHAHIDDEFENNFRIRTLTVPEMYRIYIQRIHYNVPFYIQQYVHTNDVIHLCDVIRYDTLSDLFFFFHLFTLRMHAK